MKHPTPQPSTVESETKAGFTIIEVMLFLAITGLMLVMVIGGTYTNISRQRYNDTVRSFSEYLRRVYSEVMSPESLAEIDYGDDGNIINSSSIGNSNRAIYGKIAVFGLGDDDFTNHVYTATVVGNPEPPDGNNTDLLYQFSDRGVNAELYCGRSDVAGHSASTVDDYGVIWGAQLQQPNGQPFEGTLMIVRAPNNGTIHTLFTEEKFNIAEDCNAVNSSASAAFSRFIDDHPDHFQSSGNVDICIRSENGTGVRRGVILSLDSRNVSGINIADLDNEENPCR